MFLGWPDPELSVLYECCSVPKKLLCEVRLLPDYNIVSGPPVVRGIPLNGVVRGNGLRNETIGSIADRDQVK